MKPTTHIGAQLPESNGSKQTCRSERKQQHPRPTIKHHKRIRRKSFFTIDDLEDHNLAWLRASSQAFNVLRETIATPTPSTEPIAAEGPRAALRWASSRIGGSQGISYHFDVLFIVYYSEVY